MRIRGLRGAQRGRDALRSLRQRGPGAIQFWAIALVVGVIAGLAAVGFRLSIDWLQETFYGATDVELASYAANLPWQIVLGMPIAGGLAVALILRFTTPDGRPHSVAHVIEGAAMREGRVDTRAGLGSTAASLVTLSTGGSTGREGPVVLLAGVISTWVARLIHADGITGRELLGCATAAAVAASFNAPIAGALFALEVVLRHFAVHAFAPIIIASVAGAVIARLTVGNVTEFVLPDPTLAFYVELPAFMLLGLISGLVAAVMIWSIFAAEDIGDAIQRRTGLPGWMRPMLAGAMLGGIALAFPHIIGVGYETTSRALTEGLFLWEAVVFAAIKVLAVAITMAGRMGGGVFSPSLMLGALTGLAFGLLATSIFPSVSGTAGLYALAGMGAVAAAVLGAPISTALIVFEMTGDWQAGLGVLVAVSLSSALCSRLVVRSFFLTQIERRGVHVAAGPQEYLMATITVGRLAAPPDAVGLTPEQAERLVGKGAFLRRSDTLERALPLFDRLGVSVLPVVEEQAPGVLQTVGAVTHVAALKAYARALAATAREEHS
ncbi:chloride channel protein [Halovulum dunhuangense]|uniref:Chloride channel protein n=1 Tax=Halovulum dunhuangense TaxID=1505036 RepID=A0A849L185_9RHOB|nr:chloride channel protein [Halovulum dunhuangense]NNU80024.1 chloride channel protein [Halovulum dunhuangense]